MNTTTQIIIDKYVIQAITVVINIAVKILGKILHIDHSLDKKFTKIAICKYKGMGSIIQATPLLKNLKSNYPNAKIIFVTTSGNIGIIEKIGLVDEIISLNDSSLFELIISFPDFILKLIKSRIEVYIDLEVYSNFSTLVTILSISKNRIGFYLQSKHYRLGNYTHMMYHNTRSPIHETYLQFARLMGCTITHENLIEFKPELTHINYNNNPFNLTNNQYIIINPNASDLRIERRWGKNNYRELIINLNKLLPEYWLIIIGAKSEMTYVNKVLEGIDCKKVINTSGKTNLDELISLIYYAKVLITNDSGPMHLGFACKTPTVALFGPCSPIQYGYHEKSISIYKNAYCSPCVHDFVTPPCKGNNQCMKLISVQEVIESTQSLLGKAFLSANNSSQITYKNNDFVLGTLNR
jgi:ADP-heptose:LPS heptosyltransferase